ncbi:MAG: hypothetical protein ABIJ97_01415 [Bacteroidota bacterium]
MQKLLILTVFILTVIIAFSQNENTTKDLFKVSNIKTSIWDKVNFNLGVSISFDLECKLSETDSSEESYNITAILKDSIGNILFNNSSIYSVVYIRPEYQEGNKYINRYLNLFIPDYELNLTAGKHNLNLSLLINNSNKNYGEIYSGKIPVIYLNYYDYKDQEFYISDFITKTGKKYDQEGIQISFNSEYKFMSQQVRGYAKNENFKNYFFYFTIIDENNRLIYMPMESTSENVLHEFLTVSAKDKGITDNFSFFIPYRKLNLNKGMHNLIIKLNATSKNRDFLLKEIAKSKLSIVQPEMFIADLYIKSLTVKYGEYDEPNIFGRIFSKKNKGYGYPDLLWKVVTGNDIIYHSGVSKNSFSANEGGAIFKISENDPITIIVEDQDQLVNNDFISSYKIAHTPGEFELRENEFSNKNIEKMDLTYTKKRIPQIICKSIVVEPSRHQNVTGMDLIVDFDSTSIPLDMDVEFLPFNIAGNDVKYYLNHYRLIENEELKLPGLIILNQLNNDFRLKLFIPHYSFSDEAIIGFETKTKNFDLDLYTNNQTIKFDKIEDVKFELKDINEQKISGINGVVLPLYYDIPALYLADLGVSNITINSELHNSDRTKSYEKYYEITRTDNQEYNTILGFIPFYKLAGLEHQLKCLISMNAEILNQKKIIGFDEKPFTINIPAFSSINYSLAYLKCKDISCPKIFIRIKHRSKVINESDPVSVNKKVVVVGDYSNIFYAHPEDDIDIEIIGITNYETETILGVWTMLAKDFDNKQIKLTGNSNLKKIKLLREGIIK